MRTLDFNQKLNDQFVRDVDQIIMAREPGLTFALNGKAAIATSDLVPTYEDGATWSSQGSFVSLHFLETAITLSAHHAATPLASGEDLDTRMAKEAREGRRLDNERLARAPSVVADLVIRFLTKGTVK